MSRQTIQPTRWIVVDDGVVPTRTTLGQDYIRAEPDTASHTLARNLLIGLKGVDGVVCIIEDDDYYGPRYLEEAAQNIYGHDIVGCAHPFYYRIDLSAYQISTIEHCSLAATTIASCEFLRRIAADCIGKPLVDRTLWMAARHKLAYESAQITQLKRMPGREGRTSMHRTNTGWTPDPDHAVLKQRLGDSDYATLMQYLQPQR